MVIKSLDSTELLVISGLGCYLLIRHLSWGEALGLGSLEWFYSSWNTAFFMSAREVPLHYGAFFDI